MQRKHQSYYHVYYEKSIAFKGVTADLQIFELGGGGGGDL